MTTAQSSKSMREQKYWAQRYKNAQLDSQEKTQSILKVSAKAKKKNVFIKEKYHAMQYVRTNVS